MQCSVKLGEFIKYSLTRRRLEWYVSEALTLINCSISTSSKTMMMILTKLLDHTIRIKTADMFNKPMKRSDKKDSSSLVIQNRDGIFDETVYY